MSALVIEMPAISDLALKVMMRVIKENETKNLITEEDAGPLALASALSDFFQMASGVEHAQQQLEPAVASELGHHALDLADRLSYQLRQLDIHDQRDNLAGLFASLAVWFARRGAELENLTGTADAFASLVNGEQDAQALKGLSLLMEEVLQAASDDIRVDEDQSDPWRPWRVLNLNKGIAVTRSLDPGLMEETFEELGLRLPNDVPGFFADGKRQMDAQDVPQAVRDVMNRYCEKWPRLGPRIPLNA